MQQYYFTLENRGLKRKEGYVIVTADSDILAALLFKEQYPEYKLGATGELSTKHSNVYTPEQWKFARFGFPKEPAALIFENKLDRQPWEDELNRGWA